MIFGRAIFSGRVDLKTSRLHMFLSRLKFPRSETGRDRLFISRLAWHVPMMHMRRLRRTVLLLILDGCCDISILVLFWSAYDDE